jgi:predicted acylesterase/phospholipase RssA
MATRAGNSAMFLFLPRVLVVILLAATAALGASARRSQAANQRPKIGLVLNGEGAVGFAQIGVLRWLEENHVPVDYVAGTSVGGLVGGGYASGMLPSEIRAFVERIDFTVSLFLGDAAYQE